MLCVVYPYGRGFLVWSIQIIGIALSRVSPKLPNWDNFFK